MSTTISGQGPLVAEAILATYTTITFSLACLGTIHYYGGLAGHYHYLWRRAAFIENQDEALPALEAQENHANRRWCQAVCLFGVSTIAAGALFNSIINMVSTCS